MTLLAAPVEPATLDLERYQALGNNLLVELDPIETESEGGIEIPQSARDRMARSGLVLSAGPGRILDNGKRKPMTCGVGDQVAFAYFDYRELQDRTGFLDDGQVIARRPWAPVPMVAVNDQWWCPACKTTRRRVQVQGMAMQASCTRCRDWGDLIPAYDYLFVELEPLPDEAESGVVVARHSIGGGEAWKRDRGRELLQLTRQFPLAYGSVQDMQYVPQMGCWAYMVKYRYHGATTMGPWSGQGLFRTDPENKLRSIAELGMSRRWSSKKLREKAEPVLVPVPPEVVLQALGETPRALWWANLPDDFERFRVVRDWFEGMSAADIDALCWAMYYAHGGQEPPAGKAPMRLLEHSLRGVVRAIGPGRMVAKTGEKINEAYGRVRVGNTVRLAKHAERAYLDDGEHRYTAVRIGDLDVVE